MYDNQFKLKRSNYETFSDFAIICKYYLKRYRNNNNVEISVDKENKTLVFTGLNGLCFY